MLYLYTNRATGQTITVDAPHEDEANKSAYQICRDHFKGTRRRDWKLIDVRPFVPAINGHKSKAQLILSRARQQAGNRRRARR